MWSREYLLEIAKQLNSRFTIVESNVTTAEAESLVTRDGNFLS